jgi:glycosyltransferase involved in cell wall biosynthesis
MRVLYVCSDPGVPVLGCKGAAVHVRELVAALRRAGHKVVVAATVAMKRPGDERARLDAPLIELPRRASVDEVTHELKTWIRTLGATDVLTGELERILSSTHLAADLHRRLALDPPDVVYERASLLSTVGAYLADMLAVPLLVELNAPAVLEQATYRGAVLHDLAAAAERRTLVRADAVLAVSGALRDYAVELGVEPARVHIVPNGVNASLFRPGPREESLRTRLDLLDGPVLGFVGGLRPWHGIEALPELLARLVPRHPRVRLVIAGEGSQRGMLEAELASRRLAGHVVFTGSISHDEIPALIRLFDAALAPYPPFDGHPFYFSPLKLFEYMACGVPVVAAGQGQIAEIVRDGRTGLLYAPGDLDALAAACERLLADYGLRRRLGSAAAADVRRRYTWDANAARATEIARTLVAGRGREVYA